MANIGKVYRDSYEKDGKQIPTIVMSIRTITFKKEFTIAVNKMKWESGVVGQGVAVQGKENHPDYHLWASLGKRGEAISDIVGSIKDMVSDNGLKYKKGNIFDPFIQKEAIYFTLFPIDEERKTDKNELYKVVAQPYRKTQTYNNTSQEPPQPNYAQQQIPQTQQPRNSEDEPQIDTDNDEIPF